MELIGQPQHNSGYHKTFQKMVCNEPDKDILDMLM
jgi:hypothetical protein